MTKNKWIITRRDFLKAAVLAGLSPAFSGCTYPFTSRLKSCFGIVTDSHYADTAARDNRFFRESADKMTECVELMNEKKVNFLIELGDFKDQDSKPSEEKTIAYLRSIEEIFQQFNGPTYHVLGNHDVDSISKEQFQENIKNANIRESSCHYSYDFKRIHFIVLDANFRTDGTAYNHGNFNSSDTYIPEAELNWLTQNLTCTALPSIVFCHQQLGGRGGTYVKNAEEVRDILQESGKVLAVFNGHEHRGGYRLIEGIHYYTLKGMIEGAGPENNSYAIVEILNDNSIVVTGYRKAVSKELSLI
jgi:predicted phosphodiesterase